MKQTEDKAELDTLGTWLHLILDNPEEEWSYCNELAKVFQSQISRLKTLSNVTNDQSLAILEKDLKIQKLTAKVAQLEAKVPTVPDDVEEVQIDPVEEARKARIQAAAQAELDQMTAASKARQEAAERATAEQGKELEKAQNNTRRKK